MVREDHPQSARPCTCREAGGMVDKLLTQRAMRKLS